MKQIEVVAAIIHDDKDRIFATQRGYGDYKAASKRGQSDTCISYAEREQARRSANMAAIRSKNTKPEMIAQWKCELTELLVNYMTIKRHIAKLPYIHYIDRGYSDHCMDDECNIISHLHSLVICRIIPTFATEKSKKLLAFGSDRILYS